MLVCMTCERIIEDSSKSCPRCGGSSGLTNIPPYLFMDGQIAPQRRSKAKRPNEILDKKVRREILYGYDFLGEMPLHLRILVY